jgi:methylmalonyl-CoA mutase C-terminal domain/subunit
VSDSSRRIRVLITKMGLDSHYRGAIMVARYLMSEGMEVIYAGNLLPEAIVRAVVDEQPDVLGLSSLSGNHMVMVPRILTRLREEECDDVVVVLGGVIPADDRPPLTDIGVRAIFGPGANLRDVAATIREEVTQKWRRASTSKSG